MIDERTLAKHKAWEPEPTPERDTTECLVCPECGKNSNLAEVNSMVTLYSIEPTGGGAYHCSGAYEDVYEDVAPVDAPSGYVVLWCGDCGIEFLYLLPSC